MPRRALSSILLNRNKRATLQSQLYTALRASLTSGALKAGDAVPSSRDLAADLAVSRNTVIATYDQLIGEGYLEPRPRAGLFVNQSLIQHPVTNAPAKPAAAASAKPTPPRSTGPRPFRPCQPDVRLFPLALWNRTRTRAIKSHGLSLLHYQPRSPLGLPALQRSLAEYLRDSRGVRCSPHQVAITNGSQQALYLLAQLLLTKPRQPVLMEDPGYFGARLAFQQAGAAIRPAPVDAEGLVPPTTASARLIYTTPSRQFPTGACLPVARRLSLVEWARKTNAWIIEDDYDSEFRYTRPPLPSLHSLDTTGRVIYIGSMSKVLLPALRIGYVVLPEPLIDSFADLRSTVDDHGPTIDQATLADFVSSGAFYTHIRRCRKEYGTRQEAFLSAAQSIDWPLEFPHTDGGMNLTGFFPPGTDSDDRAPSASLKQAGLDVPPLSRYSISATQRGLVFGFTAFDPPAIRNAMKRVALHWR